MYCFSITEDLQDAYSQAFLCQTASSFYVIGLILVQTAQVCQASYYNKSVYTFI